MKISDLRKIINSIPIENDDYELLIEDNKLAPAVESLSISSGKFIINKRANWNKAFEQEELSEEDAQNWEIGGPAYLLNIE